jgi:hypothetical protein
MDKIELSQEQYKKLKLFAKKWKDLNSLNHLNHNQIRRIQFLVKTKLPNEKSKLFSIITQYKQTKDIFLLQYIINIYNQIEDNENITIQFDPIT